MRRRRVLVGFLELVLVDLELVGGFLLLLDLDFLLEGVLEVRGGLLELVEAAAQRLAQFRQLSRPKDDERDHHDDDQLGHANRTHKYLLPQQSRDGPFWAKNV